MSGAMNPVPMTATFSIVGRDPLTGHLGSAVASYYMAVGAVVPFLRAGVGAINTQHWSDPDLATRGLVLLAAGVSPDVALRMVLAGDEQSANRQLLILDARGRAAVHTGELCTPPSKAAVGENCAAGGNTLGSGGVVDAMIEAFARYVEEPLGLRLLRALLAGEETGGDYRGKLAAAVRVVCPPDVAWTHACVDLRVDEHPEPIQELFRLYRLRPEPGAAAVDDHSPQPIGRQPAWRS